MDFDDFMKFFIPILLIFVVVCIGLFFYHEIQIDLELWKDDRNIVIYNECRNYQGVYYCIKED